MSIQERSVNPDGESASVGEKKEPFVKIHWSKNGFYADPKDILSHPNAKRQLLQILKWMQDSNNLTKAK